MPLGRRDARTASQAAANSSIPAPTLNLDGLVSSFAAQGLSVQDLVLLSGAHTLGFSRCTNFRDRLYNETTTLDASLAASLGGTCPRTAGAGDDNLAPLDPTPARFDAAYYASLLRARGPALGPAAVRRRRPRRHRRARQVLRRQPGRVPARLRRVHGEDGQPEPARREPRRGPRQLQEGELLLARTRDGLN